MERKDSLTKEGTPDPEGKSDQLLKEGTPDYEWMVRSLLHPLCDSCRGQGVLPYPFRLARRNNSTQPKQPFHSLFRNPIPDVVYTQMSQGKARVIADLEQVQLRSWMISGQVL